MLCRLLPLSFVVCHRQRTSVEVNEAQPDLIYVVSQYEQRTLTLAKNQYAKLFHNQQRADNSNERENTSPSTNSLIVDTFDSLTIQNNASSQMIKLIWNIDYKQLLCSLCVCVHFVWYLI